MEPVPCFISQWSYAEMTQGSKWLFVFRSCLLWQGRARVALLLFSELVPVGLWDNWPGFLLLAASHTSVWHLEAVRMLRGSWGNSSGSGHTRASTDVSAMSEFFRGGWAFQWASASSRTSPVRLPLPWCGRRGPNLGSADILMLKKNSSSISTGHKRENLPYLSWMSLESILENVGDTG